MRGITIQVCIDCGSVLTDEEQYYYENQCESCVREQGERIAAWRHGGEDPELDAFFATPERVKH